MARSGTPFRGMLRNWTMPIYGYARVSTAGQELDIQLVQLRAAGCGRVFWEKESGARDDRRELRRMLRSLRPGDVVIVTALDRLTRGGPFKTLSILNEITFRRRGLSVICRAEGGDGPRARPGACRAGRLYCPQDPRGHYPEDDGRA